MGGDIGAEDLARHAMTKQAHVIEQSTMRACLPVSERAATGIVSSVGASLSAASKPQSSGVVACNASSDVARGSTSSGGGSSAGGGHVAITGDQGGPPICEPHPEVPGKLRLLSSQFQGVSAGEKITVRLPGCLHAVRIKWPDSVKQYLVFSLPGCPHCKAATY